MSIRAQEQFTPGASEEQLVPTSRLPDVAATSTVRATWLTTGVPHVPEKNFVATTLMFV
jgi:hypothetical protein